jgi:polar amino acid transport system permease protein
MRAAILAVPAGEIEAARAFGMSPFTRWRRIIIPAMLPYAIPGLSNLWLELTKATALLAVVGYSELALETRQAAGATKAYFTFYVAAGAVYLAIYPSLQPAVPAARAPSAPRHAAASLRSPLSILALSC